MTELELLQQELGQETFQKIQGLVMQAFENQAKAEKEQKVERFRRLNRFITPGQILFAGSSLMEQFPINELQQEYLIPLRIYNRGVGGFTTAEMQEVMGPCVYDVSPKYIFLNIGTNDLNDPAFSMESFLSRYGKILDGIREHLPNAKLTLLAYYPVNEAVGRRNPFMAEIFRYRTNARIREANSQVAGLAKRYDAAFLDVNAGITDASGNLKAEYTVEGMHMYADGYHQVLKLLLPALQECK